MRRRVSEVQLAARDGNGATTRWRLHCIGEPGWAGMKQSRIVEAGALAAPGRRS
jgi:hypothetical protein